MNNIRKVIYHPDFISRIKVLSRDFDTEIRIPIGSRPLFQFEDDTIEQHCRQLYYKLRGDPDKHFELTEKFYRYGGPSSMFPAEMTIVRNQFFDQMRIVVSYYNALMISEGIYKQELPPSLELIKENKQVVYGHILDTDLQAIDIIEEDYDNEHVRVGVRLQSASYTSSKIGNFIRRCSFAKTQIHDTFTTPTAYPIMMYESDIIGRCNIEVINGIMTLISGVNTYSFELDTVDFSVGCSVTSQHVLQFDWAYSYANRSYVYTNTNDFEVNRRVCSVIAAIIFTKLRLRVQIPVYMVYDEDYLIHRFNKGFQFTVVYSGANNLQVFDRYRLRNQRVLYEYQDGDEYHFIAYNSKFKLRRHELCKTLVRLKPNTYYDMTNYYSYFKSYSSCLCAGSCISVQRVKKQNKVFYLGFSNITYDLNYDNVNRLCENYWRTTPGSPYDMRGCPDFFGDTFR
jgi:hypothetical protein